MIKHSIEINRPAEEVFAYLEQVDRHNEWQGSLVSTTVETDGPPRVGTRVVERRNVPGGRETSHTSSRLRMHHDVSDLGQRQSYPFLQLARDLVSVG